MFLFTINGSKFLGYAFFNITKKSIQEKINEFKIEHKKATHICYAAILKDNSNLELIASDDGEPKGTASTKIKEILLIKEQFNCLIVVIRYFGGSKLGASKLSRTYKNVALWTLDQELKKNLNV